MSGRNPFDEFERLLDRFGEEFDETLLTGGDVAVDVEDRAGAYVVRADLPGYDRADIDVEVGDGYLTVSAERSSEAETARGEFVRRERTQESVSRTLDLPGLVAAGEASATYDEGVLTVTLPKAEGGSGHEIEIE
ncbi:MAG: Hsp20/alpha crystallin family protein [Halobacteriaceae archaeon]